MIKQKALYMSLTLAAVALLPGTSSAHMGPLAEFDTNGDGKVTQAEFQAGLSVQFVKIDTDADGFASLNELQAWQQTKQLERFNTLDADTSASLSLTEFQAADAPLSTAKSAKLFTLLDVDANSTLSLEEFAVLEPGKGEAIRRIVDGDSNDDLKLSESEFLTAPTGKGGPGKGNKGGKAKRK